VNHRRRTWCVGLAVLGLAGAGIAAGCGAAGVGLGSLGVAGAAVVFYALFALGGGSGCSPRSPTVCLSVAVPPPADDAGAAQRGEDDVPPAVGPCLRELVGPCLQPTHPCLSISPTPCLSPPEPADASQPPVGPCLEPETTVCLSLQPPEDAGAPPPVRICLSDDLIEGEMPSPCLSMPAPPPPVSGLPAERTSATRDRADAAVHLAAAGILSDEQLRRLARLRGES
jgi:hypothetical protein